MAFRVVTGGLGFLLAVLLVGRVSEGIAAGTGAATAMAFGLGTLALPLAATMFGHVVAGALGSLPSSLRGPVRVRTRAQPALRRSGTVRGIRRARRVPGRPHRGCPADLPGHARDASGARVPGGRSSERPRARLYNLAAFESPVRFSYRYVTEEFAAEQAKGFFGIGVPPVADLARVLVSWDGLVVQSPMLMLAGAGIVLLWQSGIRAEAFVCGAITLLFLVLNAGYYDPIGGLSPGPRFFVPALRSSRSASRALSDDGRP